ncbi:MAG: putative colanic acid biosynthesis acetyltransferase [Verrucomicrobiota bacterium]
MARVIWGIVQATLFNWSPRPLFAWRGFLLKCFGAQIGSGARVHRNVDIWAPWNLEMGAGSVIGPRTIVYSQGVISIGKRATVSQGSHLCAGTHDHNDPTFPLITKPIRIGDDAWVAAEVFVHPGVDIAEGCVIGARSVVTKSTSPWKVYSGFPAKFVSERARGPASSEKKTSAEES